jgi:hypothetical protein
VQDIDYCRGGFHRYHLMNESLDSFVTIAFFIFAVGLCAIAAFAIHENNCRMNRIISEDKKRREGESRPI